MDFDRSSRNPLAHWPRPLAFVLSGGGSYGASQVGMVQAMVEAGITPDLVVGTSVGAMNGALFASDPAESSRRLTEIWHSMTRANVYGSRTRIGTTITAARNGLRRHSLSVFSFDRLNALIDEHIPVETIEDLTIPTVVVVTDALVGQPKLLRSGPLSPALRASAAIPGVFPPVEIQGCFYIDGGVSANVPVRQAVTAGARSMIVLDANPATMPGTLPHSVVGSVVHASMIMLRNQRADAVDDLTGKYPILHLPQVTPPTQSSFEFDRSSELVESGYVSTKDFLTQLPELADSSRRLSPHTAD